MKKGTRWCSHIGIVVRFENDPEVYTFESDNLVNPEDVITHVKKDGVKVVKLKDKLKLYEGYLFAHRRLTLPPELERSNLTYDKFINFIKTTRDKPYEYKPWELATSVTRLNLPDYDAYFCVELVTKCYLECGFLDPENTPSPNNTLLSDYIEGKEQIHWSRPGIMLGHEHYVNIEETKKRLLSTN